MKPAYLILFLFSFSVFSQNNTLDEKKIDSLLHQIDTLPTDFEKISELSVLIGRYRDSKLVRKFADKSLEISNKSKEPSILSKSEYALGCFYYNNSQLDSSLIALKKANNYIKTKDSPLLKSSILSVMGAIHKTKGNSSLAISTLLEAKKILDNVDTLILDEKGYKKFKGQNLILNNTLANFYNQMEEYEVAIPYYNNAIKTALELGSKTNAGIIMSNKGDLLLKMKNYEEGLHILKESKELKIEGGSPPRFIANTDLNIGIAYFEIKNYEEAEYYFKEAFKVYSNNIQQKEYAYILTHRGILLNAIGKFKQAKNDCEKAKKLAITLSVLEYQLKSSECLFEAYKGMGDYQKSLENHEIFLTIKDSLFNKKNIKKLTQLEMQYGFDKKQELQKIEAKKTEQEKKLYLFLALAGLIIVLLLGFFYIKNQKKNKLLAKQKKMLEITIDEKNTLLKETHHRVKNSFQIVSSLLYLQSESITDKEAKIAIKEAQNRVRSMVLIHQRLYSKEQLVGIDTLEYITDLVNDIIESHLFQKQPLAYSLDIEPMVLTIETITPIGLIINELIVNVLKHAFTKIDENSTLTVSFKREGDTLVLQVQDNGNGIKEEIKNTSFGIKLIKALAKKLKATLLFDSPDNKGTLATLTIKRFNIL